MTRHTKGTVSERSAYEAEYCTNLVNTDCARDHVESVVPPGSDAGLAPLVHGIMECFDISRLKPHEGCAIASADGLLPVAHAFRSPIDLPLIADDHDNWFAHVSTNCSSKHPLPATLAASFGSHAVAGIPY